MRRYLWAALLLSLLGCGHAELVSIADVNANRDAFTDRKVQIQGVHVKANSNYVFVTTGLARYFVLEDDSGKIRVWYNVATRRCLPRLGSTVTVTGKIVAGGAKMGLIFAAKSISIDEQVPLAKNEVRLCQLSRQEQQLYAEEGEEGLQAFWRAAGKPERVVVYD